MKKSLADKIEEYIKVLIEKSGEDQIVIQRIELAETFCCVPSQVSYVLSTRFTKKAGFVIESRKGGKGFVRIIKSAPWLPQESDLSSADMWTYLDELLSSGKLQRDEYESLCLIMKRALNSPRYELASFLGAFQKAVVLFVTRDKPDISN